MFWDPFQNSISRWFKDLEDEDVLAPSEFEKEKDASLRPSKIWLLRPTFTRFSKIAVRIRTGVG